MKIIPLAMLGLIEAEQSLRILRERTGIPYKSGIMKSLKNREIWLCWNYKDHGGKRTKVPIAADGGKTGTVEKYKSTWVTFAEAVSAQRTFGYDGVGFVIPDGYFFIDIDHRDLSDPLLQQIQHNMSTYAEFSVSGEGIHIYGKCTINNIPTHIDVDGTPHLSKDFYQKNPTNGIEVYFGGLTNRFAVYTGNAVQDIAVSDCTEQVLDFLNTCMRRPDSHKTQIPLLPEEPSASMPETFDADKLIAGLRSQRNSDKFKWLFDDGDISGYRSHSEADLALCAIIAFRTGPNPAAIDVVFRKSALYRKKWEREDYRSSTIKLGIEACNGEFYTQKEQKRLVKKQQDGAAPHKDPQNTVRPIFVLIDDKGKESISTTLLAEYFRQNVTYIRVRDNATQGVMTYIYGDGYYHLVSDDILQGVLKKFVADYNPDLVRKSSIMEALFNVNTDLEYVSQDDLDADEDVINFQNGLLYISRNGFELKPHTPKVLSTIQLPCDWPDGPQGTPVFDNYMNTLTMGNDDLKRLLMQFIGVCLSNIKGYRLKKALFMVGPGDTGKSQLLALVQRILGKGNFTGIELSEIEARFGTSAIYCKRLVGSADMHYLSVKELKTFKKLTGGDSVFAEFKGKNGFEYTFGGMIWFCMNDLPRFGGDDGEWVYERIMPVWCYNVIPKDKQDKMLADKMFTEKQGIVYQAVTALMDVINNGYNFSEPAIVKDSRQSYFEQNNTVIAFFCEYMAPLPNGHPILSYSTQEIYEIYQNWCRLNNHGFEKTFHEFREILTNYLGVNDYSEITTRINGRTYFKQYYLPDDKNPNFQY